MTTLSINHKPWSSSFALTLWHNALGWQAKEQFSMFIDLIAAALAGAVVQEVVCWVKEKALGASGRQSDRELLNELVEESRQRRHASSGEASIAYAVVEVTAQSLRERLPQLSAQLAPAESIDDEVSQTIESIIYQAKALIPINHPASADLTYTIVSLPQTGVPRALIARNPGGDVSELPAIHDRYKLLDFISHGGMKEVYRAVDLSTAATVAVAFQYQGNKGMWDREIDLSQKINSPFVVRLLDSGVAFDDRNFIVLEYCPGPTLRQALSQNGPLPALEALPIMHAFATGLRDIHKACVLHRDVKLDNAILTPLGLKILDFGISEQADNSDTAAELPFVAGTLKYMAPENLEDHVDARSDVYSLGVCFFELLTGQAPLKVTSAPLQHMLKLKKLKAHDLSSLPEIPQKLRILIQQMLAIAYDQRPYIEKVVTTLAQLNPSPLNTKPAQYVVPDAPKSTQAQSPRPIQAIEARLLDRPAERPQQALINRIYGAPGRPSGQGQTLLTGQFSIPLNWDVPCRYLSSNWPRAPHVLLKPGPRTQVQALSSSGQLFWAVEIDGFFEQGLVADIDGDGVGELYLYNRELLMSLDGQAKLRFHHEMQWTVYPQSREMTVFLSADKNQRSLVIEGGKYDAEGRFCGAMDLKFEGHGQQLVKSNICQGHSLNGLANQAFRGSYQSPAAILHRPGRSRFHVAHLEGQRSPEDPSIKLSIYGPGGALTGRSKIGTYDFLTSPLKVAQEFYDSQEPLFDQDSAPLAYMRKDGTFIVIVPYLINAPWFGPVIVAVEAPSCRELWRLKLPGASGAAGRALLADIDGDQIPELIFNHNGVLNVVDINNGQLKAELKVSGQPLCFGAAASDHCQLTLMTSDSLDVWQAPRCLPGLRQWPHPRGDLWRTGALLSTLSPLGPTV
jgi:serine/threonine protein kinase